jgi:hypothetical protein
MRLARFSLCKPVHTLPALLRIRKAVVGQPDLHTLLQFFDSSHGRQKLLGRRNPGRWSRPRNSDSRISGNIASR